MRPADEPAVRSLQAHLEYADPDLVTAALGGPFLGLVAVSDGSVVGYAVALPGPETTLSELAVAPDHRRSGHGRRLVEAVAENASDEAVAENASDEAVAENASDEAVVVTTPRAAAGTRRFYEALGFAVDERLERFYADGTGALRLVRRE